MLHARYSCSTKIRRTIWCENVILESEIFSFALLYTASEKPYAPPITNTRCFAVFCFFCNHAAKSIDRNSFPCSSSSTTVSAVCISRRIVSPSRIFCCASDSFLVFFSSGMVTILNGSMGVESRKWHKTHI